MAVVVIGGQASGVGKTGVVCAVIAGMRERRWTAIKISQLEVGESWTGGDDRVAILEERAAGGGTDSARYLAAGAARSFWVRTRRGQLEEAMPRVRALIDGWEDAVLESNSVLEFLRADFYGVVVDSEVADFKASAIKHLDRADALLVVESEMGGIGVDAVLGVDAGIPRFAVRGPGYISEAFLGFLAQELHKTGK